MKIFLFVFLVATYSFASAYEFIKIETINPQSYYLASTYYGLKEGFALDPDSGKYGIQVSFHLNPEYQGGAITDVTAQFELSEGELYTKNDLMFLRLPGRADILVATHIWWCGDLWQTFGNARIDLNIHRIQKTLIIAPALMIRQ